MNGLEAAVKISGSKFKEVAELLQLSPKTINDWGKGRAKIPKKHLEKLSTYFGVPAELLTKENLTAEEELKIKIMYLKASNKEVKYPGITNDENFNECEVLNSYNTNAEIIHKLEKELEILEKTEVQKRKLEELFRKFSDNNEEASEEGKDKFAIKELGATVNHFFKVLESEDVKKMNFLHDFVWFLASFSDETEREWRAVNPFINEKDELFRDFKKLFEQFSK